MHEEIKAALAGLKTTAEREDAAAAVIARWGGAGDPMAIARRYVNVADFDENGAIIAGMFHLAEDAHEEGYRLGYEDARNDR